MDQQIDTSSIHARVLSIAMLAIDTLAATSAPEGLFGVITSILKKTAEKNPQLLIGMLQKQIEAISEDELRKQVIRVRDEIAPYLLGEDGNGAHTDQR